MTPSSTKLHRWLVFFGWASIIGYVVSSVSSLNARVILAKSIDESERTISTVSGTYIFGLLIESPLHLASGVLCFFAAWHLTQPPTTISETFE